MRPLDLAGMVLAIIGVNIIITTGLIFIMIYPQPGDLPRLAKMFRIGVLVALIIGILVCIIGIILRVMDSIAKEKELLSYSNQKNTKTEVEIVNEMIIFLKNNKGKAFTMTALLNRINEGNLTEFRHDVIERLLHERVLKNVISSQLKDEEIFYLY